MFAKHSDVLIGVGWWVCTCCPVKISSSRIKTTPDLSPDWRFVIGSTHTLLRLSLSPLARVAFSHANTSISSAAFFSIENRLC